MAEYDKLKNLYYATYYNINDLIKQAKKDNIKLKTTEIKKWYNSQVANQLFKQPKKEQTREIKTVVYNIGNIQIDLLDMQKYKYQNSHYKFILNCIDVYSRFVFSFKLKDKKPSTIEPYLKKVFNTVKKNYPENKIFLYSDKGNEFQGPIKKLCEDFNIKRYYNDPENHDKRTIAVVERFNQTILLKFRKLFIAQKSNKWIDQLQIFISQYNNKVHSSIHRTPYNVFFNKSKPLEIIDLDNQPKIENVLKIGDYCRIVNNKQTFAKKTMEEKLSRTLYIIHNIINGKYELMNYSTKKIILKNYQTKDIYKVQQPNEIIDEQKKTKNKTLSLSRNFNVKKGHEVEEIDENGNVLFKKRLQPKNKKRQTKKI
ncbi:MAG: hypothetical protein WC554_02040 [Clostridia bacterium]|jgi:hypothetical protein